MRSQANKFQVRHGHHRSRNLHCAVVRDSELHPALSGPSVAVRSVDCDIGVYAKRYGNDKMKPLGDLLECGELTLRFHIDASHTRADRALQFDCRLSDAAEDDVGSLEAGCECAVQLPARNDVHARAKRLEERQDARDELAFTL